MDAARGDSDYSTRIGQIKKRFTHEYLATGTGEGEATFSRKFHRIRGVWEKRFYEHTIRGCGDFKRHLDYIHFNPVKHGRAARACDWPWSTFMDYVTNGEYSLNWAGHVEIPGGVDVEPDVW